MICCANGFLAGLEGGGGLKLYRLNTKFCV